MEQAQDICWYAARAIKDRSYVKEIAARRSIQLYIAKQLPTLVFMHCSYRQMEALYGDTMGKLVFYRNLETRQIRVIPDKEMETFIIVTSAPDEAVIPIDIKDPSFFQGQKVRVLAGPFKGAEGVIKRIKGDRRLLVQVTGVGAIATSYIPPQLLEAVE